MTKYTKIEQMVHEMLLTEDKAIPRIASSKSSDQKLFKGLVIGFRPKERLGRMCDSVR